MICLSDTHLEATKKWFDKEGIKVSGYFQWKQVCDFLTVHRAIRDLRVRECSFLLCRVRGRC